MSKYSFHDMFDINTLQTLMDSLSATLQVSISIRSPKGAKLTPGSYYCDLCRNIIRKSPVGKQHCEQADLFLCANATTPPCIRRCSLTGMTDVSLKITIANMHVASLLVGQILLDEDVLSDEEYRAIARSLEINEDEYLEAIHKLPVKTKQEFQNILTTLTLIAEQFCNFGYQNHRLKAVVNSLENRELLQRQELDLLEQLADRDTLTGLYNRRKFDNALIEFESKGNTPLCIISADANYLKITNDVFGHECGDSILKSIGHIMNELAKTNWLVARCGGDEFRVILPGTRLETALDYCRRVTLHCQKDKTLPIPLSVALGAAEWDRERENLEKCFARADEKMYQHKRILKQEQNLPDYIMERLYDRQILNREVTALAPKIVYDFAIFLGLSTAHAKKIALAIQYEDIGMAKLPEYFMIRGQSRTLEETKQIQQHVYHSNQMVRQFEDLYPIADIILYAHENWDGNGYPKHLTGPSIPLESRIIRIVNNYTYWTVFTMIGSNLTKEEAKARLVRESGKMYDPELISKFLKFLKKYDY